MRPWLLAIALGLTSCMGTTGSGLITFPAYASGPPGAAPGLSLDSGAGFHVTLTTAKMHVGAVYITASALNPSSQNSSCIEPGQYVGEVSGGVDVDLLSDAPQAFTVQGSGTANVAQTGEVWLTGGDVNAASDGTTIVSLAGVATRGGTSYPFQATVTIAGNRLKPVSDPALPGLNPICKRRIVTGVPVRATLSQGAVLRLRVDPRAFFNAVDFSKLDVVSTSPTLYGIPDSDSSGTAGETAGRSLFTGIRTGVLPSGESAYSITFE